LYSYCENNPINWIDPWGLCKKSRDVGLPEYLAARLYEFGHKLQGGIWAIEYGLTKGIDWSLTPLSWLSDVPDIIVPATRYNPQFRIPCQFIGTMAEAADRFLGDWLEHHAEVARKRMEWHFRQRWQYGNMEWHWPGQENENNPE